MSEVNGRKQYRKATARETAVIIRLLEQHVERLTGDESCPGLCRYRDGLSDEAIADMVRAAVPAERPLSVLSVDRLRRDLFGDIRVRSHGGGPNGDAVAEALRSLAAMANEIESLRGALVDVAELRDQMEELQTRPPADDRRLRELEARVGALELTSRLIPGPDLMASTSMRDVAARARL